ncbi:GDYXXLXY domain-containing protein [Bizionia myxarmorum]|uniref:GDYXXLXY domain-containing protein n=1 Tax=Bizionia myxarmorum TaxID=291186 RepID=A0A5D0RDJ8_9FLAO|nr:GDYXXLXY domain-containing protein [Bizionia myxarmorum]TYB78855.1 GDYXXLXY domain-containing protein [Bizionia myxarmorum]
MKKYKWLLILGNLLVLLFLFNASVYKKETLLKDGKLILLELAPVDPRSLMQGDYMDLRYDISNTVVYDEISKRGFCVVKLDENGIAKKNRFQDNKTPLKADEYLIAYNSNSGWGINIGAESYFFQEGDAEKYEVAKYGGIKVDEDGNSVLIGLYDENRKMIN